MATPPSDAATNAPPREKRSKATKGERSKATKGERSKATKGERSKATKGERSKNAGPKGRKRRAERQRAEHGKADRGAEKVHAEAPPASAPRPEPPLTLTLDIGGTGIKTLVIDREGRPAGKHRRQRTPRPAHPAQVLATVEAMLLEETCGERVSVGFPGVVVRGIVKTAPNLDTAAWRGFDLQRAVAAITGRPTRVINDADLLGLGVIAGRGVELVLTLGTGLGSALFVDGRLVPNLELGHHPFKKGQTYEERIADAELKRIGRARFRRRVGEMIAQLAPILNYERLYLGGGNARLIDPETLPDDVSIFTPAEGMRGGLRLWDPPA